MITKRINQTLKIFIFMFVSMVIIGCSAAHKQTKKNVQGGSIIGKASIPLEETYIYVYTDKSHIHGPWHAVSEKTSEDGSYSIENLSPGKYYIVARKRQSGGIGGPLTKGDYKSEVYGPIEVKAGEKVESDLYCKEKKDDSIITNLADVKTETGISGIILDSDGNPVSGIRVHIYTYIQMSERPKYVSDKTGPDGKFTVYLPEGGTYYLSARDRFGGPPAIGELYGRFDGGDINPTAVVVKENEMIKDIKITVHKVW